MTNGMADVIAAHRPSRWRSFTNENEILRCCGRDFGNATKKAQRGDNAKAWAAHAAHVAEELGKAGFGKPIDHVPSGGLQQAFAEKWDEGGNYAVGHPIASISDRARANPYRRSQP